MSEKIIEQQGVGFKDVIPKEWLAHPKSEVTITAYRIINYGTYIPNESEFISDLDGIRAVLVFGNISYPHFDEEWDFSTEDRRLKMSLIENNKEKSGAWLIFIQPTTTGSDITPQVNLSSHCALYVGLIGRQIAFHKEFQYNLHADNKTSFLSKVKLTPSILKNLDLDSSKLNIVKNVAENIKNLDTATKHRVMLSLHWFEKGVRTEGVDAFLSLWIALESLAMPDSTNIKPIKQALARIYNLSEIEVGNNFCIGQIFGLRSKIVHDGLIPNIRHELLEYMQALFMDILLDLLKIPSTYKVKSLAETTYGKQPKDFL